MWWFLSWTHAGLLGEYSFFPLWLGYIAVVNAASDFWFKDSLLRRMQWSFLWLFVISVPLWWSFEFLNSIVHNWHYVLPYAYSALHFDIQASVDFSTVVPAVLSAAFLFVRLFPSDTFRTKTLPINHIWLVASVVLGILCLGVVPLHPNETFPLIWIAPLLIIDPLAYWLGLPSVWRYMQEGEWRVPVATACATLFTGFWWELWNFFSLPKWVYTIPYVGFWKIFEMPLLGYGGYLLFGLIIFSYTLLAFWCIGKRQWAKLLN